MYKASFIYFLSFFTFSISSRSFQQRVTIGPRGDSWFFFWDIFSVLIHKPNSSWVPGTTWQMSTKDSKLVVFNRPADQKQHKSQYRLCVCVCVCYFFFCRNNPAGGAGYCRSKQTGISEWLSAGINRWEVSKVQHIDVGILLTHPDTPRDNFHKISSGAGCSRLPFTVSC